MSPSGTNAKSAMQLAMSISRPKANVILRPMEFLRSAARPCDPHRPGASRTWVKKKVSELVALQLKAQLGRFTVHSSNEP